jgi:hypothetical protein
MDTTKDAMRFNMFKTQHVNRIARLAVAAIFCFATATLVLAHGGRLGSYGCHRDRRAGDYHCHKGPLNGQHFASKELMLGSIANNCQDVTPPAQGTGTEPACTKVMLEPPDYYIAPRDMLDWTSVNPYLDPIFLRVRGYDTIGFMPSPPAPRSAYNSAPTSNIVGAPGSTLGANEGPRRRSCGNPSGWKDRGPHERGKRTLGRIFSILSESA